MTNDGGAVTIRPAAVGDLQRLLVLYAQLENQPPGPASAHAIGALEAILLAPYVHLVVAELDGVVAGTATFVIVPNLTHGGRPWMQLENMVVDETVRRRGVGRALMVAAERLARQHGCYKIQLQSAEHRTGAHRFYEAAGFRASSKGFRRYFA
ncbi:MAG: GNAT family N-acetyltransferase [Dehalococcoidia bacterium]|nr:GNAT family N-acetyltransferase [Dehalococcoidia bacterium]